MKPTASPQVQRGVTLIVGLIMLVVMTLMVTSAFMMSNTNLKAIGNMQLRDEAISAANAAIEEVVSSLLIDGSEVQPPAQEIKVNIANLIVWIGPHSGAPTLVPPLQSPTCIRATELSAPSTLGSGSSVGLVLPGGPPDAYNTVWAIDAAVTDTSSGASIRMHQGVRVLLTKAQKEAVCN